MLHYNLFLREGEGGTKRVREKEREEGREGGREEGREGGREGGETQRGRVRDYISECTR